MMMMALRRLLSNGWTVCRLRWISIIDKGIVPAQDAQITGDCNSQEVQMNRVLKAVVLFLILTGIAWKAVACPNILLCATVAAEPVHEEMSRLNAYAL